jgi:hypothetical protein
MNDHEKTGHLHDSQIVALLAGDLGEEAESAVEAHLTDCEACRERLQVMSGADRFDQQFGASQWDVMGSGMGGLRLLEPGEKLGRYVIEKQVAVGGSAVVYRAGEVGVEGRTVAIKMLQPSLQRTAESVQRFMLEAKVGSHVQHPGVLPVLHVEAAAEPPWLVMPFIKGETLQARLERQRGKALPMQEVLMIAKTLAAALQAAHEAGVIHRDVKPSNILLATEGDDHAIIRAVYLADFGLARVREEELGVTRSGTFVGTPQFMSPEQAKGDTVDAGSDLFSLGAVLYILATGRAPFEGETFGELAEAVQEHAPLAPDEVNPELPNWLNHLIFRLLTKNPAERLESASEVFWVLETERDLGTVTGWRLLGNRYRLKKRLMRVGLVAGGVLVLGMAVLFWSERSGRTSWVNGVLAGQSGRFLYVVGQWGTYETVGEAIAAAKPGGIIEARTNMPAPGQGGLRVPKGKPLTLRAAPGFRPRLHVQHSGWPPVSVVESDFTLEGFDVNHVYRGQRPGHLILAKGARLRLVDCRFVRMAYPAKMTQGAGYALVGMDDCPELEIVRCEMYAAGSPLVGMIGRNPKVVTRLVFTESQLWGNLLECQVQSPEDLEIVLDRCEVFAGQGLHFRDAMPTKRLAVTIKQTVFQAVEQMLTVPHPREALAAVLDWQGKKNRYFVKGRIVLTQDGWFESLEAGLAALPTGIKEEGSTYQDQLAMPFDPEVYARALRNGEGLSIRLNEEAEGRDR